VASPEAIKKVAALIKARVDTGQRLCVVVSAMGKTTDQLLQQASLISKFPSRRELDMLLTCGERASMALLAMALNELSVSCVSLTGSQSGIITDNVHAGARIVEMRPFRVLEELNQGKVVIVAGFQGVSLNKEITTLGRGGSDTTAVALAAALDAAACEIYSDVAGIYTADPRVIPEAELLDSIGYDHMIEMARNGAKVMNEQAVRIAQEKGIIIHALKTGHNGAGTAIGLTQSHTSKANVSITHKDTVALVNINNAAALSDFLRIVDENRLEIISLHGTAHFSAVIAGDEITQLEQLLHGLADIEYELASSITVLSSQSKHFIGLFGELSAHFRQIRSLHLIAHGLTMIVEPAYLLPTLKELHRRFVEHK